MIQRRPTLAELARQENDAHLPKVLAEVRRQDKQYQTLMHMKMMDALREHGDKVRIHEIKSTSIGK